MENNQSEFSKAELKDYKKMWESEIGQKAYQRLESLSQFWLERAMYCNNREERNDCVEIATGIQFAMGDIKTLCKQAEDKKEGAAAK